MRLRSASKNLGGTRRRDPRAENAPLKVFFGLSIKIMTYNIVLCFTIDKIKRNMIKKEKKRTYLEIKKIYVSIYIYGKL